MTDSIEDLLDDELNSFSRCDVVMGTVTIILLVGGLLLVGCVMIF